MAFKNVQKNNEMTIKKSHVFILSFILSLLIVFAGVVTYAVTAKSEIQRVEQKVDLNKDFVDKNMMDIKSDISEIKSDIKYLLKKNEK